MTVTWKVCRREEMTLGQTSLMQRALKMRQRWRQQRKTRKRRRRKVGRVWLPLLRERFVHVCICCVYVYVLCVCVCMHVCLCGCVLCVRELVYLNLFPGG